jgi:uncharacterized membrane protein
MHAEIIVLRLVHILSGIFWVGSGMYANFFLVPALRESPAVMGQVMAGLMRRRVFRVIEIAAGLTILSGLRLMWIDSSGFSGSYFDTGMGNTLGIGGAAAIIAAVFNFGVGMPAMRRAGALAASLGASSDAAEKARLAQQVDRLRKRAGIAGTLAISFGILAASAMAIARYV